MLYYRRYTKALWRTFSPLESLYTTHLLRDARQYSTRKASAYSWPWPLPNRPCVSVHVIRWSFCRSTSKYSLTSLLIWAFGHQAPPFFSWFNLKKIKGLRNNYRKFDFCWFAEPPFTTLIQLSAKKAEEWFNYSYPNRFQRQIQEKHQIKTQNALFVTRHQNGFCVITVIYHWLMVWKQNQLVCHFFLGWLIRPKQYCSSSVDTS